MLIKPDPVSPCCRTLSRPRATGRSISPGARFSRARDASSRGRILRRHVDAVRVRRQLGLRQLPARRPIHAGDSAGTVHIAWWTGKQGSAGVFYARSTDKGATFGEPIALGAAEFSAPAHVQLALGAEGSVVAVWDDGTVKTPRVVLRVSHDNGASFGPLTLVSGRTGRDVPGARARRQGLTIAY